MKLVFKYLKPFAALVLVCILLLFGQAACDLSLPNLMSNIVNVGIQQGGIETGAPEVISLNGMKLLQSFMTQEEKDLMDENYSTILPESSEALRLEEQYPLARDESICVINSGADEETLNKLNSAYASSAYAFMLYMQQAQESGELEEAAKQAAMSSSANFQLPQQENLPEGVIGQVPEGAIVQMPGQKPAQSEGGDEGYNLQGSEDSTFGTGSQPIYTASSQPVDDGFNADVTASQPYTDDESGMNSQPDAFMPDDGEGDNQGEMPSTYGGEGETESGLSFDISDTEGFADISMSELYQITPLLSFVPQSSIEAAISTAHGGVSTMGDQVGVTFKRLFYQEIGLDVEGMQSAYIWRTGLQMLGVAFLGVIAAVLVGFFSSRIAATVGKRLRQDLFSKVESFSNAEFDKFSTASLITRTTNDVQQVQMLIPMGIRMMCYAPIIGIGGIIFAVGKSVSMSWIVAVAVVVMLGMIIVALAVAMPRFKALQKLIDRLNLVSRENLSGMMVVRAFGNEKHEEERFDTANKELADTNRFVQRVMSALMPGMMLLMNITSVVIVWVGGHAIADSTLQIGDMMAFIQYAMQIISAFLMIAMMFVMVPRASVSAVRISEVLDTPLEIKDPEKPETPEEIKGEIEFKNVSFKYGGAEHNVLENISFTAKPGETTAFIGSTGSGKSTLINLIPRFYDVTEGEIQIDGIDIRKLTQSQLRNAIGYVPQKGMLFSGTIDSNIRYGKEDAEASEIAKAIEVAQAEDFVSELEQGGESAIAQGGGNVSGGQRQRLSIARALVRKSPIYIFDDSFSALDFKTDAALRKALNEYTADATVLIVAQRVSTIMSAQQIIVLDGGKMVGKGTHKELLESCPEYREIAESQLQKEELE